MEACDVGGGGAIALVLGWADTVAVISPSILLLCEHSVGGAEAVALVLSVWLLIMLCGGWFEGGVWVEGVPCS